MLTNADDSVTSALAHLLDDFVQKTKIITGNHPRIVLDDALPDRDQSPAILRRIGEREAEWLPCPHNDIELFAGIEKGLGVLLHDHLKHYYGDFWSEGICCQSELGPVQLIQVWNETDLELLKENLLGHAFMKNKKKQPLTFFFGVGEGENILTIENCTGRIFMEVPGRRPHTLLAENLADYLNSLEVMLQPYGSV